MRTKMSIGIILAAVAAIGLTAVSANGQTSEARRAARRERLLKALASLDVQVDPQLPCYGEPKGQGPGCGIGQGNWFGRPAAQSGRFEGCSDCGVGGRGCGTTGGSCSSCAVAQRSRLSGCSDGARGSQGRGLGGGNWNGRPGAGRGGVQGCIDCGSGGQGRGAGRGNLGGRPGAQYGRGYGRSGARNFAPQNRGGCR